MSEPLSAMEMQDDILQVEPAPPVISPTTIATYAQRPGFVRRFFGRLLRSKAAAAEQSEVPLLDLPADSEHLAWALEILDKQYRLYSWNDAKIAALVTTNGLLFAAIGFLFSRGLDDELTLILILVAALSLAASLVNCLRHIVPRLRSGRGGDRPNPRSLSGIAKFDSWEKYRNGFVAMQKGALFDHTMRQIYGMAYNSRWSEKVIRWGSAFTRVAVVAIFLSMITSSLSAGGVHPLGQWQKFGTQHAPTELNTPLRAIPI